MIGLLFLVHVLLAQQMAVPLVQQMPVPLAQQMAEPPGAYALVCNATTATLEVTLVEQHTVAPDDCHKFDLGTGDARTVTLAAQATKPALRFVRLFVARFGTQAITLVTKQADCPAASENRVCALPAAAPTPQRRHHP